MIYHFSDNGIYSFQSVVGTLGLPGGSVVKNLPASARGMVSIPGIGRSSGEGNGNPLQVLAWKIPRMEEPGRLGGL